jgi:hypothetical protein
MHSDLLHHCCARHVTLRNPDYAVATACLFVYLRKCFRHVRAHAACDSGVSGTFSLTAQAISASRSRASFCSQSAAIEEKQTNGTAKYA